MGFIVIFKLVYVNIVGAFVNAIYAALVWLTIRACPSILQIHNCSDLHVFLVTNKTVENYQVHIRFQLRASRVHCNSKPNLFKRQRSNCKKCTEYILGADHIMPWTDERTVGTSFRNHSSIYLYMFSRIKLSPNFSCLNRNEPIIHLQWAH